MTDDDDDTISIKVVLPCCCMMQYADILLYISLSSPCLFSNSICWSETWWKIQVQLMLKKKIFCLQCYCSLFMHDWMYECGFLYGIVELLFTLILCFCRCSYISIRCFMYNATINLECNRCTVWLRSHAVLMCPRWSGSTLAPADRKQKYNSLFTTRTQYYQQ